MLTTPPKTRVANMAGRIKFPLSPQARPSFSSTKQIGTSSQSFQLSEEVINESEMCVMKARNVPVPVQVQEELKHKPLGMSVKIHDSGWVWMLSQKRLYIWKQSMEQKLVSCYQLSLPLPNKGEWNVSLVDVELVGSQMGVVAVSPEGSVLYWRSIFNESHCWKTQLQLKGEDFIHSVTKLQGSHGFVILSHLGLIFLLNPLESQSVTCLDSQKGVLSGFVKRVSSLFFQGGSSANNSSVRLVTWYNKDQSFDVAIVMNQTHLQCWKMYSTLEQDQVFLWDLDLVFCIKRQINDLNENDNMWLLDLQCTNNGLLVLYALSNGTIVKYGLAQLPLTVQVPPLTCDKTFFLQYSQVYQFGSEAMLLNFYLQCLSSNQLAVYSRDVIIPVHLGNPPGNETISFKEIPVTEHNAILGSGLYNKQLLFFTVQHGIVSLTINSPSHLPSNTERVSTKSHAPVVPHLLSSTSSNMQIDTEKLQKAFLHYINDNLAEALAICHEIFPVVSFSIGIDTPCDVSTVKLSEMILNDLPAADPRWNDINTTVSVHPSSASLIILNQLQDKQEAHKRFIHFLADVELLHQLTCVTVRGKPLLTCDLLCEHAEKIAASITLKNMQDKYVDESIKIALQKRPPLFQIHPGLTAQDVFYSQVSNIDDIFTCLLDTEDELGKISTSLIENMVAVIKIASVFMSMLKEAVQYRRTHVKLYASSKPQNRPEFIPWTASRQTLEMLRRQLCTMLDCWTDCHNEPISDSDQETFWTIYAELSSLLFTGVNDILDSINEHDNSRKLEVQNIFDADKNKFIAALLDNDRIIFAMQLAEQYRHFPTLVQVSESQNNPDMLMNYFSRFKDHGFTDYIFHYCLDNSKIKLLIYFSAKLPGTFVNFLQDLPNLLWLHYLAIGDYNKSAQALMKFSQLEQDYVARKKTALSMSKLMLLSKPKDKAITMALQEINCELAKVEYQEKITTEALQSEDIHPVDTPPLSPDQVIQLLLKSAVDDQIDLYKFAINYLQIAYPDASNPARRDMQMYIWSQAILKTSSWTEMNTDEVLYQLEDTFFYKLAEECHINGLPLLELLPTIDELLMSPLLNELSQNTVFVFCMKTLYERLKLGTSS